MVAKASPASATRAPSALPPSAVVTSWATTPCCLPASASASRSPTSPPAGPPMPRAACGPCALWRTSRMACSAWTTCSASSDGGPGDRARAGHMNGWTHFWEQGDAVGKGVAIMLLLMSISAWVVIFWKGWLLSRARRDLAEGARVFWKAPDLQQARTALRAVDREAVLLPLVESVSEPVDGGTLEGRADR